MTTVETTPRRRLFNRDEYHRMADIGVLHPDERVELLNGVIYPKFEQTEDEIVTRRFTRDEYHRMLHAGILDWDERIELIEGEILVMSPMGTPHTSRTTRLQDLFYERLYPKVGIRTQSPIVLGDDSEPEPDLAIVVPREDRYAEEHPKCDDILLLVEVADSSARADRRIEIPTYASHGIREVWLVDVNAEHVEVHTQPHKLGFEIVTTLERGDSFRPTAFPDVNFEVNEILGPPMSSG